MKKEIIKIKGMHCAACAINVSKALNKQSGIKKADVNFATERAGVEFNDKEINLDKVKKVISEAGYEVVENGAENHSEHDGHQGKSENKQKIKTILAIILAAPVVARMFWMWEIPGEFLGISFTDWTQHDLTFIIVFIFGWQFHSGAFKQLKRGRANMDSLISLGDRKSVV